MKKILIVEDNEMNSDMLSRRLSRRGFEVIVASDGQQGLNITQSILPDLVLMDMSLPVMDGWEATRQIKSDPKSKNIPVIGLSAHAMSSDFDKAREAGCDDYDIKPVDITRLLGKINVLLN